MRLHSTLSILALSALLSVSTSVPGFAAVVRSNAAASSRESESAAQSASAVIQAPSEEAQTAAPLPAVRNETSLGVFTTTGFTNPRGERSATIYIVEDTGVRGQVVDVYYANTSEAWAHGVQYREVFLILE